MRLATYISPISKDQEWPNASRIVLNEPHKAVSWITAWESTDEERKVDIFLAAGLARIDNVFMKTQRLFSALECPAGTSSGQIRVWHGCAPYNPRMLEKYSMIFRSTRNFLFVETDEKMPAMRLGFARQPLRFEDILWPGQRIPRPTWSRRKGRALAV